MKRPVIRRRETAAPSGGGGLYFAAPKPNIDFVRTGCTMLDCIMGGGLPLGRISNLVGDKSTGKTLVAMETFANLFRQWGNAHGRYAEAESAFDQEYARALGIPIDRISVSEEVATVEQFHDDVSAWLKKKPDKAPGLYVLDSLDGLSDAAEMEREIGEGSYGAAKAKKLSEFFRRQKHELKAHNAHLLIISQVRDNIGVTFGSKHTRSGGKALDFYASQVTWLAHKQTIKKQIAKIERPVGISIKAKNTKNKVGLPLRDCEFDITFGYGIEDERASREWLASVGSEKLAKVSGEELREAVLRRWFEVEKTFLPERRKYVDEGQ